MPTSLSHSGSSPRAGPDQVSLLSTTGHKGGNMEFMPPECTSKTSTLQMSAPDLLSRLSKVGTRSTDQMNQHKEQFTADCQGW